MKNNIIKAEDLPENEIVYLKKDIFGWRVVEPINNEDGSINYRRLILGSKRSWLAAGIIVLMFLLFYLTIHDTALQLKQRVEAPCYYCADSPQYYNKYSLNFSWDMAGSNMNEQK